MAFELTRAELVAIASFLDKYPAMFLPEVSDANAPSGSRCSHVVASDGKTLLLRRALSTGGDPFFIPKNIFVLLRGTVPGGGSLQLSCEGKTVSFAVFFKDGILAFKGSFTSAEPELGFLEKYPTFLVRHEGPVMNGTSLDWRYLSRLTGVGGTRSSSARVSPVRVYVGKGEFDPVVFVFDPNGNTEMQVVIMPIRRRP